MSETSKTPNRPMRGPGHGPRMMGEKAKDFKGSIKKMWGFVRPYRVGLILVMVFAVGSTIFNILGPKILAQATNELFTGLTLKV